MAVNPVPQFRQIGRDDHRGRPVAGLVKAAVTRRGPHIQLHRLGPAAGGHLFEAGGRVHRARGADGDKQIAFGQPALNQVHIFRHFPKPDDIRAQGCAEIAAGAARMAQNVALPREHPPGFEASCLEQFAVHMDHGSRTRALVQVIHVLGDQAEAARKILLKIGEAGMGRVGRERRVKQLLPSKVVKALHARRIAPERLGRGHVLDPLIFPQAVIIPEGPQPRFGGDTRAGEDYNGADSRHNAAARRRRIALWGRLVIISPVQCAAKGGAQPL